MRRVTKQLFDYGFSVMGGLAHKLQATTRSGSLFRIELLLIVYDPEFLCKAVMGCLKTHLKINVSPVDILGEL
jgi:hypothetical protein